MTSDKPDPCPEPLSPYPEHEKLHRVVETTQAIGLFIDWLGDAKGIRLAHNYQFVDRDEPTFTSFGVPSIQDLLAEYFGLDRDKLDEEKERMLGRQRELNEAR